MDAQPPSDTASSPTGRSKVIANQRPPAVPLTEATALRAVWSRWDDVRDKNAGELRANGTMLALS